MRKILAFIGEEVGAVEEYRIFRPLEGFDVEYITKLTGYDKIINFAKRWKEISDVWITKYPNIQLNRFLITASKAVNAKLITDIDDFVWSIPKENSANEAYQLERINEISRLIKEAHAITVSTQPLKEILEKINPNCTILPNVIKPEEWKGKKGQNSKKVRIGWVYSKTHRGDTQEVKEALEEIFDPDLMEIVILAGEPKMFNFKYKIWGGVPYMQYPNRLRQLNLDISLAPLKNDVFNRCKSNIKWLESSMAGSSFIGSRVYPYETSVEEGKTGLLAGNKEEWKEAIMTLVKDEKLRNRLVRNARKEVLTNYTSLDKHHNYYKNL